VEQLKGGLVVSCQAPADSPLHDPDVIAAMAVASVNQGAVGVRIDTPAHIARVRSRLNVPVIGLWKRTVAGFDVYITPQFEQAQAIAAAGANIIAVDGTPRPRPGGETLPDLIAAIHNQLHCPVMADIDTLASAEYAAESGADYVGTTLYGYTAATRHCSPPGFDLLKTLVAQLGVPVICEGGIASPAMVQQAMQLGAYTTVVGTAITGIDQLAARYVAGLLPAEPSV